MFKTPIGDDSHKQTILSALDHIDGILGEAMGKVRANLKGTGDAVKQHEDSEMAEEGQEKYEGQDKPGGHAGHSFGGKTDQHGENNFHAGHTKDGDGDTTLPGMARKRSGSGFDGFKALFNK